MLDSCIFIKYEIKLFAFRGTSIIASMGAGTHWVWVKTSCDLMVSGVFFERRGKVFWDLLVFFESGAQSRVETRVIHDWFWGDCVCAESLVVIQWAPTVNRRKRTVHLSKDLSGSIAFWPFSRQDKIRIRIKTSIDEFTMKCLLIEALETFFRSFGVWLGLFLFFGLLYSLSSSRGPRKKRSLFQWWDAEFS